MDPRSLDLLRLQNAVDSCGELDLCVLYSDAYSDDWTMWVDGQ